MSLKFNRLKSSIGFTALFRMVFNKYIEHSIVTILLDKRKKHELTLQDILLLNCYKKLNIYSIS